MLASRRPAVQYARIAWLLDMGSGPPYTWDVPGEESSDRWAVNF